MAKRKRNAARLNLDSATPPYLSRLPDTVFTSYAYEKVIANGKTGTAYLFSSLTNSQYKVCLKTIREDIIDTTRREEIRASLDKEVKILSPLRHCALPHIVSSNTKCELPYYVCTFHAGETLEQIARKGTKFAYADAVYAIRMLLDVIFYLHSKGRVHCDLHANNVLLSGSVYRDGILVIDLGSGHRDSSSDDNTPNRGNVNYKPFDLQGSYGIPISRSRHLNDFQLSDFSALGRLLGVIQSSFLSNASPVQRDAYREFSQALAQNQLTTPDKITDFADYVADPYRIASRLGDVFSVVQGEPDVVALPVSGAVRLGAAAKAVVQSPEFQRLKGIKQLSFCDWVFPGATHTRYEHVLGVFTAASKVINHMTNNDKFRRLVSPEHARSLLLAALVHDIGHYPFAHVMEQYAASRFPNDDHARKFCSHEEFTIELLDRESALRDAIDNAWGSECRTLAIKILERKEGLISEVLDGPIDIDKIDYLARDAVHTGVAFGGGLNADAIISSFCWASNGQRLGISESGLAAVEGLMILQDQMLGSVYWHERVRGMIATFHSIVAHIVGRESASLHYLVSRLKQSTSEADALITMSETVREFQRQKKLSDERANLLTRLIQLFRDPTAGRPYVHVATFRNTDAATARVNVYQSIVQSQYSGSRLPIDWSNVRGLRDAFIHAFKRRNVVAEELQIVVDVPYGKGSKPRVMVCDRNGAERDITELSHLNSSIFEAPAAYLSPIRVFADGELVDRIGGSLEHFVKDVEEIFFSNVRLSSEESQTAI